ncbi:MAG: formate--tetrahydrofolate ligase [Clostridia bacterium]|nr:formate--tetrahydrofolate ligase [Clostridia bacterium]
MLEKIQNISNKLDIPEEYVSLYGKYIAKISLDYYQKIKNRNDAKLILMTSINPTPFGEGKTTQSIGLAMAMNKMNKKTIAVLREPSLGPVFGIKGGAVGGGKAIIEPKEDIDLHFTGDFHAITSANNLLCAVIDNSIFQGNEFHIDPNTICIKRVMDMNDRSLRDITIERNRVNTLSYKTGFEITAACELMAICCLAQDMEDLKNRIDHMLIAYDYDGNPVYVEKLGVTNAMLALLKYAICPNLVQTSENTPCILHLGPFANIAHGCNSVIATKFGLKLADYCITEAGFGADLGAEKFLDIKCRKAGLRPDIAVIVVTIKALKYHGGMKLENINEENLEAVKKGILNLEKHIDNMKKFGLPIVICVNQFDSDTENEIKYVKEFCLNKGMKTEISTVYADGADGGLELAKTVCEVLEHEESQFKYIYDDSDSIEEKVAKVSKEIYGASKIIYEDQAKEDLEKIKRLGFEKLPICIAKTPNSLSDNPKLLGRPQDFSITVRGFRISSGAGFIVVYAGNIMTMPALGKNSRYKEF